MITVIRSGPLTTVQDLGRRGYAHLGVPRSGALDAAALRTANALVGNSPEAAGLETTLLGCALRFDVPTQIAVTGAAAVVKIDGEPVDPRERSIHVPAGAVVDVGRATAGVRSYLAVAGGIAVEPVLGSRATDTLSGLGPPVLTDGMVLPIGTPASRRASSEDPGGLASYRASAEDPGGLASYRASAEDPGGLASYRASSEDSGGPASRRGPSEAGTAAPGRNRELQLGVRLGPRDDWVVVAGLFGAAYRISPVSNRVGCRLAGTPLPRARAGELPPEGIVLGAIQVPSDGQPLIFLADHPTTGGYPVIGVVDDVTPLAQARPGTTVRFRELH